MWKLDRSLRRADISIDVLFVTLDLFHLIHHLIDQDERQRNTYFCTIRFRNLWSDQSSFEYVYVTLNTSSWPSWIVSGYPSTILPRHTTFVSVDENEKSSIHHPGQFPC